MKKKTTKQRIREEVKADQARYDEVTRRLLERIQRGGPAPQPPRTESS
jgi:hypothetical protein